MLKRIASIRIFQLFFIAWVAGGIFLLFNSCSKENIQCGDATNPCEEDGSNVIVEDIVNPLSTLDTAASNVVIEDIVNP